MTGQTRVVASALVRQALRGEGAPPVPHLLVRPPDGPERAVALGPEVTVGRDPRADLVLPDAGASRRHLRLRLGADGAAEVEDLASKNGLTLNGRRLAPGPSPLRHGDELTVGATRLRFVDPLAGPGDLAAGPSPPAPGAAGEASGWRLLAAAAGLLALAAGLMILTDGLVLPG